jgi:hypothetical protein
VRLSISGGSTETRDVRRRPICALPRTESGAFSSSCSTPRPVGPFVTAGCDAPGSKASFLSGLRASAARMPRSLLPEPRNGAYLARNRKFESISLQRGVTCEPDFRGASLANQMRRRSRAHRAPPAPKPKATMEVRLSSELRSFSLSQRHPGYSAAPSGRPALIFHSGIRARHPAPSPSTAWRRASRRAARCGPPACAGR